MGICCISFHNCINCLLQIPTCRGFIFNTFCLNKIKPSYVFRAESKQHEFFLRASLKNQSLSLQSFIEYKHYSKTSLLLDNKGNFVNINVENIFKTRFMSRDSSTTYIPKEETKDMQKIAPLSQDIFKQYTIKLIEWNSQMVQDIIPNSYIQMTGYYLPFQKGDIAVLFIQNTRIPKNSKVILFSHGNMSDIGTCLDFTMELTYRLDAHLLVYDYPGYGQSSQCNTAELSFLQAISTAYDFLVDELHFDWFNVILYGYSLGTGPSLFLSSQREFPVLGLILHSPFYSISSFISTGNSKILHKEPFPNSELMKVIRVQTMIIHGNKDKQIPFQHAIKLAKICENSGSLYQFWQVDGGDHSNIDQYDELYMKLQGYLAFLENQKTQLGIKGLRDKIKPKNKSHINHMYSKMDLGMSLLKSQRLRDIEMSSSSGEQD